MSNKCDVFLLISLLSLLLVTVLSWLTQLKLPRNKSLLMKVKEESEKVGLWFIASPSSAIPVTICHDLSIYGGWHNPKIHNLSSSEFCLPMIFFHSTTAKTPMVILWPLSSWMMAPPPKHDFFHYPQLSTHTLSFVIPIISDMFPLYRLWWEFLSWMDVKFCQMLSLHLSRWSCDFYNSLC